MTTTDAEIPDVESAIRAVRHVLKWTPITPKQNFAFGLAMRQFFILTGAGMEVKAGIIRAARDGEVWARKLVRSAIEDTAASGRPVPEPLTTYLRDERAGKMPPSKRGSSREARFYRDIFLKAGVATAMLYGLPRTRTRTKHDRTLVTSACSLVQRELKKMHGLELREATLERMTDDLSEDWFTDSSS